MYQLSLFVSALPSWLLLAAFASIATAYKPLSDSFLRAIPSPGDNLIDPVNGTLLAPLLITRVPGTPGQKTAQAHLHTFFTTKLPSWTLTWQNSTSITPATGSKQIPFANLIAKREPPWTRPGEANLLTLVAHYDSKRLPDGFLGATDSAAPCAMLMWTAMVLDKYVTQMYEEMGGLGEGGQVDMDMGVQILFLDGEEAFVDWSATDSLYGSRYVYCIAQDRWDRGSRRTC
jgi:glutaminyl-peptide cyclotransferase